VIKHTEIVPLDNLRYCSDSSTDVKYDSCRVKVRVSFAFSWHFFVENFCGAFKLMYIIRPIVFHVKIPAPAVHSEFSR